MQSVWCTGDHLVGWANSSIRHPDQLPDMTAALQRKGVIREDPVQAALHPEAAAAFLRHHASPDSDNLATAMTDKAAEHPSESGEGVMDAAITMSTASLHQAHDAPEDPSLPNQLKCEDELDRAPAVDGNSGGQQQQAAEQIVDSSRNALLILQRLQTMPWRRIDVSFEGTKMPFFAHNHMQVTRKWLNWYGISVCQHLAQQLAHMEKDKSIQKAIGCSTALSVSS